MKKFVALLFAIAALALVLTPLAPANQGAGGNIVEICPPGNPGVGIKVEHLAFYFAPDGLEDFIPCTDW